MQAFKNTIILLLVFTLNTCAQKDFNAQVNSYIRFSVDTISVQQLDSNKLKNWKIIDSRSLIEYNTSKIKNAQFLNYDKPDFDKLSIEKSDTILVYCTIGYRSEKIGEQLKKQGFRNVYNLYGGILAWANNSKEVYTPFGTTTNKIHTYDNSWGKWLTNQKYIKIN